MKSKFVGRLAKPALGGLSQESVRSQWINLALILALVGGLTYSGRAAAGTGPQVQLAATQSPLDFGNVSTGTSKTKTITLTNSGSASIRLSQAHVSGSSFKVSGLNLPLTLGPRQKTTFSVVFAPRRTGNINGTFLLVSNAPNSPATMSLRGVGVQPQLSVSPTSANFGNVVVGTRNTYSFTLTNSGNANVTVFHAYVSGSGVGMSGLGLPLALGPGQKATFSVVFAPTSTGSVTGSISLVSNASNSPSTIAFRGTAIATSKPQLSVIPTSASFGNVAVGTRNTQTITLINPSTANLTILQAAVAGKGLSMTGMTLPLTLSAGQRTSFNVAFAPASAGSVTGNLSLVSDAPNSPITIALSGSGIAATSLLPFRSPTRATPA